MAGATIPGPTGLDMLRGIRQMRAAPPEFLARCAERFGPVVQFPIPRATVLYLADPSDVRHVLQKNHTNYTKQTIQYSSLSLVTGSGLLTSDGDVWRQMRRMLQPAFHAEMVDEVQRAVVSCVAGLRDLVSRRGEVVATLDELMLELSLHVVGAVLLGRSFGSEGKTLVSAVSAALQVVVRRAQQPLRLPGWMPNASEKRLAESLLAIDTAVDVLVENHRSQSDREPSALALLLQARRDGLITDGQVRDEVVTFIVAGHETVAATLTWACLLLAAHPDVQRAVTDEVDAATCLSGPGRELLDLDLTKAVVDECLRLYPPAWAISRRARQPDNLGGLEIPPGATIITSPYALHRDPDLWADPLAFNPERFLEDAPDRSVYLPFGAGPRLCIGREMALYEAPLLLASMAREFDIQVRPTGPVGKEFGVTLRPSIAVPVRLSPRRSGVHRVHQ